MSVSFFVCRWYIIFSFLLQLQVCLAKNNRASTCNQASQRDEMCPTSTPLCQPASQSACLSCYLQSSYVRRVSNSEMLDDGCSSALSNETTRWPWLSVALARARLWFRLTGRSQIKSIWIFFSQAEVPSSGHFVFGIQTYRAENKRKKVSPPKIFSNQSQSFEELSVRLLKQKVSTVLSLQPSIEFHIRPKLN